MLDLIPRIVATCDRSDCSRVSLSAPRAVYAPLLTPQKYARESGKTYGHPRLVFSLDTKSIWLQSSFRLSFSPWKRQTTTTHTFCIRSFAIDYGLLGKHVLVCSWYTYIAHHTPTVMVNNTTQYIHQYPTTPLLYLYNWQGG